MTADLIEAERTRVRVEQRRRSRRDTFTTVAVSVGLLLLWEVAADLWLTERGVLASPTAILGDIAGSASIYTNAFLATAWVAVRGWFWGNLAAIVLAVLFVQFRALESLFLRLALTLFCLPLVAVMPILQLTFDSDTAKVVITALAVFFTTLVGTMLGLRSAEGGPLTMVQAWGGGLLSALRFVRMPSGVPAILTGLQIGSAAATLGAVFSEFIGAQRGLGVLLINGLNTMDLGRVWGVALLATVMAAVPYALLGVVRNRIAPWSGGISDGAALAPARAGGSPATRVLRAVLGLLASLAIIVAAWWLYLIVFDVSAFVGKNPIDVYEFVFTDEDAAATQAALLDALGVTVVHALVGYLAGMVVGVLAAVAFTLSPVTERVLTPLAVALRSVPIIVLIPVLILALGRGLWGVVAITAIVTFFPTLANVQTGLRRVPADAMSLMHSYSASTWTTLFRLQLPYTLPAIFASARIAAPTAVLAATLAEWLATGDGLGYEIVISRARSEYAGLWAAAVLLTIVSVVFYSIVTRAERAVLARYAPAQLG